MIEQEDNSDFQATLKLAYDIGLFKYKEALPTCSNSLYISNRKVSKGEWKMIESKIWNSVKISERKKSKKQK